MNITVSEFVNSNHKKRKDILYRLRRRMKRAKDAYQWTNLKGILDRCLSVDVSVDGCNGIDYRLRR